MAVSWIGFWACAAAAQDVHDPDRGGPSRFLRRAEGAAEEAGVTGFPRLTEEQPGTIVELFFDYNDWDIVFITANTASKESMIEDAKGLAVARKQPRADYYVYRGTKYLRVDVELNDYLSQNRGMRSVDFNLGDLSSQVAAMKSLPRPVWFVVEADNADGTILRTPGEPDREIDGFAFYKLGAPGTNGTIVQSASIPWFAIPLLLGLGAILVTMPIVLARGMLQRKAPEPIPEFEPEPELKSPEVLQAEYEKNRKFSWLIMLPLLLLMPAAFVFISGADGLFDKAFRAIPSSAARYLPVLPIAIMLVPGGALLIRMIGDRRNPPPPVEVTPETRQMKFLAKLLLIPLFVVLAMVLLRNLYPGWATMVPTPVARALPIALPLGMLAVLIIGGYRLRKQTNVPLPADSPYRQFAISTGAEIGTKIRDLFQVDADYINAMATLSSKIGLTKGLLTKMEPDEIKAVIAHEIGHQRARHVKTLFFLSLGLLIALFGLRELLLSLLQNPHPLLRSPLITIPLVMLLPYVLLAGRRRRAEFEADRFAVDIMGDPEIVIAALRKMSHLNQTPLRLVGIDEKLSTHPSVSNREAAIREYFRSKESN